MSLFVRSLFGSGKGRPVRTGLPLAFAPKSSQSGAQVPSAFLRSPRPWRGGLSQDQPGGLGPFSAFGLGSPGPARPLKKLDFFARLSDFAERRNFSAVRPAHISHVVGLLGLSLVWSGFSLWRKKRSFFFLFAGLFLLSLVFSCRGGHR